ncbi:hypothetical protein N7468_010736 [Penicillium chermesinum]|uniref:Chromosome segregation ATPase family protein n=1 Tax=Penicillium chermesinum TaxID=63820 RepID=A0A9W9TA00_9EURO|nr:uncharacterized protein N7468_010736 [Penicillium chermesinum]KAJ5215057.1 hypothetical protein N7468_010736 [Penicillium chermesinum]
MGSLANQIHSLTNIASNLQREMMNLSRRSKDNATDLISLKAATDARDEDIRQSLKELSANLATKILDGEMTRSDIMALLNRENGSNLPESDSSPASKRSYSVPRMPSPNPFVFDRDIGASPAPISDGSASIALLEKVLREMATKEGEERLLELVDEIKSRPAANASDKDADKKITNMLEEILNLVKDDPSSRALVRSQTLQNLPFAASGTEGARSISAGSMDPTATVRALNVPKSDQLDRSTPNSDEMLAILRSVKSSVMESGGMTSGVKALVRELRGEVLGMGRDIARQLEAIESTKGIEAAEKPRPLSPEEISSIVNNSLFDLREQLAATINESREQSAIFAKLQATMNSAEIYSVVKRALDELEFPQLQAAEPRGPVMEKEEILETVREAWETYKPEIELQNFGLERDEILECLSEGLKSYEPKHEQALTYEQVLAAVQTGMQSFQPPPIEHPPTITRDEIILTIRECLEKPEPASRGLEEEHVSHLNTMRDEILQAVSEKLQPDSAPEPAVKSLDEEHVNYLNSIRDEILHALAEKSVESAPRSVDDEHLNHLYGIRDEIMNALTEKSEGAPRSIDEAHVEHLHSIRDEILNAVTASFTSQSVVSKESLDSGLGRDDIVTAISDGLDAHFTTAKEMEDPKISRADVVSAVTEALDAHRSALTTETSTGISRDEIMTAIIDGIEIATKAHETTIAKDIGPSLSREEILDAISEGIHKSGEAEKSALSTDIQSSSITREEVFNAIVDAIESSNTMTREIELNKDDLMEAISAGLHDATTAANLNVGEQVLERLQDVVDGMKEEFKQYSTANGKDTEQVLDAIKDGLHVVRKEIEAYAAATGTNGSDKHEIIDTVKEGFRLLQADMEKTITDNAVSNETRSPTDTSDLLDAMEKEFEHLRGTISQLLINKNAGDKDEILDAIHEVNEQQKAKTSDEQIVNTIREEFENLRERMDTSLVRAEPPAEENSEKHQIIAALQEHFETLQETIKQKDGSDSVLSVTSELLDAFNEGIDSIRGDVKQVLEKPTEFDSSEILTTIKDGLAELRLEIDAVRQSQKDADDASSARGNELMLANGSDIGSNIEGLKDVITQLQEKVDSIDTAPRDTEPSPPAEDALNRGHFDELLVAIQEVQIAIGEMGASKELPEGVATKEHTDALESLLVSTKDQIAEIKFPTKEELATSEQIGVLEVMVAEAKDAVSTLSARLEAEASTKSDIGLLENLIKDVWVALDELKSKTKEEEEKPAGEGSDEGAEEDSDKLLKSDLQTVEAMVFEVKTQIDELKLPDVETLPTKEEIQGLSSLVTDFRERMEANNELTAQGFEARKVEHGGLAEKIDEAKMVVGELGEQLKSKLDGSSEGLTELKGLLEGLALSAENFSTVESIKELTDLINREFERSRGEDDATKLEKEERDAAALIKHDETRAAIIVELGAKIDEKIEEIMAKYDDAHASLHSKLSEAEERDLSHAESVTSTKALAEDIKLVIGSMGTTVTDTCEQMSEETKALSEKVTESYARMEEMHNEAKSHQEQTRGENERAVAATERVESKLLEFHPQILETVQEILNVVSQHYDHSQKSADEVRTELSALPAAIPQMLPALPPPESSRDIEDDPVHHKLNDLLEHAKSNPVQEVLNTLLEHSKNEQIHEKLDRALEQASGSSEQTEQIYEKLNQLLDHATAGNAPVLEKLDALLSRPVNAVDPDLPVTQMMKLDEMHKDIMENTRKMNEMFAFQSSLVAQETERKRQEAEEAAIALERRNAQREQVEAEIIGLNEEKESLLKMIHTLKTEKDDLAKQNMKLSKELSGLETTFELRREEMHYMQERADELEKRILEGVLDHARSVFMSRSNSLQNMNLKRNRSTRSSRTGARSPSMVSTTTTSTARGPKDQRSLLGNGVGMALKRRGTNNSLKSGSTAVQPNIGKERRILSLSHVTGNSQPGKRHVSANTGITNLKRSHSVKSDFSLRKTSWAGRPSVANKENEAFPEEEEPDCELEAGPGRQVSYRQSSYAGTERKSSYAGTITDSVVTGGSESGVSEDRRTSGRALLLATLKTTMWILNQKMPRQLGKTTRGEAQSEEEAEDTADDGSHVDEDSHLEETASVMEEQVMKLLGQPADSGLGTDVSVA